MHSHEEVLKMFDRASDILGIHVNKPKSGKCVYPCWFITWNGRRKYNIVWLSKQKLTSTVFPEYMSRKEMWNFIEKLFYILNFVDFVNQGKEKNE